MTEQELLSTPEACDGCGKCVEACREVHGTPEGAVPGIQVARIGESAVPVLCRNCEEAPCVSACMPGCRYRDEATGRVVTDYERCVGCWMCIMLCPFGAIARIPAGEGKAHGVALKCDGCVAEASAPCADACSRGGLRAISPRQLSREKRDRTAGRFAGGRDND